MVEVIFAAWLAVAGALLLTPTARWIPAWGAVFLAPIVSTALFVLTGLALVSVSMFSVEMSVGLVSIVALAVFVMCILRRSVTLWWLVWSVGGAVIIAVVVTVVTLQVPMVRLTTDSFHYLMSSGALVRSGTLEGVADIFLLKRQLATPLLHTLGVETGRGYVSFWTPLLGVATFGTLTWLAQAGLRAMAVPRRWQWTLLISALAFSLTSNRVMYHFFYINGHMLFASLLLVGVGLGWMAVRTGSWALLLPASLAFAALVPLRAESVIVAGAFLVVFVSSLEIPLRWRWVLLGPILVSTLLWDGWVLPRLLSSTSLELLKSPLGDLAVVAGLVAVLLASSIPSLSRILRVVPLVALGALAGLLAVLVLRDPQVMLDTIIGMSSAITTTGFWGTFWLVVPVLFVAGAIIGFPNDRYMILGLLAFALILPILAYLRGAPFGDHLGDSANRMVMHVAPLLILVIVLSAGRAAGWAAGGIGGGLRSSQGDHAISLVSSERED
jgi:hypothetical protein